MQFNKGRHVVTDEVPSWFTQALLQGIIKPEYALDSLKVEALRLSTVKALEVVRDHDWVIRDNHTHVLEVCPDEVFRQSYTLQP